MSQGLCAGCISLRPCVDDFVPALFAWMWSVTSGHFSMLFEDVTRTRPGVILVAVPAYTAAGADQATMPLRSVSTLQTLYQDCNQQPADGPGQHPNIHLKPVLQLHHGDRSCRPAICLSKCLHLVPKQHPATKCTTTSVSTGNVYYIVMQLQAITGARIYI